MSEFLFSTPKDISSALQTNPSVRDLKRRHVYEMQRLGIVDAYEYSIDLVLGNIMLEMASQEEELSSGLSSDETNRRIHLLSQLYPGDTSDILEKKIYNGIHRGLELNRFHLETLQKKRSSNGILLPAFDNINDGVGEDIWVSRNFVLGKIDLVSGLEMFGTSVDIVPIVDSNRDNQWVSEPFSAEQVNLLVDQYDQQLSVGLFTDEAFKEARSFGDMDGLDFRNITNSILRPSLFR